MTLKEFIENNRYNTKTFNFCILINDTIDIINTKIKITFNDLRDIIGSSVVCMEIEDYQVYSTNIIQIKIKNKK